MTKVKTIIFAILALIISFALVYFTSDDTSYYGAQQAYRVYLDGNSIALIKNKEKLENYIDKEQEDLKEQYNVSKIYVPSGIEIKQELTYDEKLQKPEEVYDKIKDEAPFTIEGYVITLKGEETTGYTEELSDDDIVTTEKELKIYVLDKEIFEEAINSTVLAFIDEEEYQMYLEESQPEIGDLQEGEYIENVYIKEKITIKKDLIPVDEEIFMDSKMLARYLLYGTTEDQQSYIVKNGDTLENIANNHKLNVRELLIVNRDLSTQNALLYEGQTLTIGYIDPIITVIEEKHEVAYQTIKYNTVAQVNPSVYVGYSRVIREGSDGQKLVTQKVRVENGATTNAIEVGAVITKEAIDRVVETGSKSQIVIGSTEFWAWPTTTTYISEGYGWRTWEGYTRMHNGVDIASNCGTPIYAANDGTVVVAHPWSGGYSGYNQLGNYVQIDHNNGFNTLYAHLTSYFVQQGEAVTMGQLIGTMGTTGYSFGCHLHYETRYNGQLFNPLELY